MKVVPIVSILFFCFVNFAGADIPFLEAPVFIEDGGVPLSPGMYTIPEVVDWNNDGAKDLVVGVYTTSNNILLYINQGTDLNPVFNGGNPVESGGVPITVSWG